MRCDHECLYLDAHCEKVRQDGQVRDTAVLKAAGVNMEGKRGVLGVSVSLGETEAHRRALLKSLVNRRLSGVGLLISDAHAGLAHSGRAVFGGFPWQRCQFHLQQNAQVYVPRQSMKTKVAADIRAIFNAPRRHEAERMLAMTVQAYQPIASRLSQWFEESIPEGLTIFLCPPSASSSSPTHHQWPGASHSRGPLPL